MGEVNIYEEADQARPKAPTGDGRAAEQPEPTQAQPATLSEAQEWADVAARGDSSDNASVPGEEAVAVPPAAAIPFPEPELPFSEPVALAGDDGREPMAEIRTGPGMPKETAEAIREQQRLAHDSQREQQVERREVFALRVAAVQEFAQRFENDVYRTGEAFAGERAMASTELPQVAVAALRQAETAYLQVVKASNGRVPENVANALAQTRTELAHQGSARQARERVAILERETKGTTLWGTDKPLQKEMRSVFDSLRRLGNYDQIQGEIEQLQGLRDHALAKSPEQVNREIARLEELQRAHESIDGLLAWKGLDPKLRGAIAAVRAGRRLHFGDTSKYPVDALRQKFYKEVVTFLVPPETQSRGEASAALIPAPERAGGRAPQAAEADEESSMDDPVSRLRLIAERKTETRTSQEKHRQAIREGNGDAAQTARHLIDIAGRGGNHDEVIRMAQQLVADLLDDMKTMTPEEQENTKTWLANFTGELMVADHARDFGVDLMDEASLHVFRILSRR